jgi:MFS family permease
VTRTLDAAPARLITARFLVVSVSAFAYFLSIGVLLPTLPRYVKDELGGSNVAVGAMLTVYGLAAIAVRPLLWWYARRFGERSMMLVGAVATAVVLALHPLAANVGQMLGLRMLVGMSEAMLFVGAATIINNIAPAHRRAEAASYFSIAVFAGIGIGPVVGDRLADSGQYTATFLLAAAFALASFLAAFGAPGRRPAPAPPSVRRVRFVHPAGVVTGVVLASAMIGYIGWSAFLALRADQVGASAGTLFLVYSVLVIVLRLTGAKVPERVGLGRCAAFALVLIGTALVMMAVIPGAAGLWAGTLVLSIGITLLYPSLMAISVNSVSEPAERTAVVSTFTMFFEVGAAVGGLLLGGVAAATSYQGAFLAGGLVAYGGLLVLWRYVIVPRRAAVAQAALVTADA